MEIGNYREKLAARKPEKGIYRYFQNLAKEACNYFGDKNYKDMGRWIGYMSRVGIPCFMGKFEYVKEKGITNARYFAACFRIK